MIPARIFITALLMVSVPARANGILDGLIGCFTNGGSKMPKVVANGFRVKVPRKAGGHSEGVVLESRENGDLYVEFDDPTRGIAHKWVPKSALEPAPEYVPPYIPNGTRVVVYRSRNNQLEYGIVEQSLNGGYDIRYEDGSGVKAYAAKDVRVAMTGKSGAEIVEEPTIANGVDRRNIRPQEILPRNGNNEHLIAQTEQGVWDFGKAAGSVLAKRGRTTPNEDSIYVMNHEGGLELGVIDGMGGYGGGDVASQLAAQTILGGVKRGSSVKNSILEIPEVYARNLGNNPRFNQKSGVVLVTASVKGNEIKFQSVGDAKGAVFTRNGNLIAETPERSLGAEQSKNFGTSLKDRDKSVTHGHIDIDGVSTKNKPHGVESIDTTTSTLHQDDWVVLASDGIWDNLTNEEVGRILNQPGITAREATERIRQAALNKGYKSDDIGIVVYQHR